MVQFPPVFSALDPSLCAIPSLKHLGCSRTRLGCWAGPEKLALKASRVRTPRGWFGQLSLTSPPPRPPSQCSLPAFLQTLEVNPHMSLSIFMFISPLESLVGFIFQMACYLQFGVLQGSSSNLQEIFLLVFLKDFLIFK